MKRVWRSFNFNIGRILAYIVVGLIIALFSSFLNLANVNAAIADMVYSGDSLKGRVSIGTQKVGANYYYSFNNGAYDQSVLNLDIPIEYIHGLSSNAAGTGTGTIDVGFQVEYCVNSPNAGLENIYSYYDNSIDFQYNNGTKMYLTEGDWSQSNCYTAFVRLKLNYSLNYGVSDPSTSFTQLTDRNNTFAIYNNYGYMGIIRYTDMIYLNEADYNERLEEAKSRYNLVQSFDDISGAVNGIGDKVQGTTDKVAETNEKLDKTNQELEDLNDNITDTDTSGSEDLAGGFFEDFDNEDYGLSDIITMPLQVINNITSATCSPLELPLPFVDTDVTLPCMYSIYQQYFGGFLSIYQTITFGIVAYWVCINIFRMVKNFKNPDNDEVEVLDL